LAEERPVDRDTTPDWVVAMPVDADAESVVTALLVVDRPVDRDTTPDCAVETPVEAEVDSELRLVETDATPD
jgi:hypothetical protein